MNRKTIQKILDDENVLDIELMAKAHTEQQRRQPKRKTPATMQRSVAAWHKLKAQAQEEEGWRQKLKKVWNKKNPS